MHVSITVGTPEFKAMLVSLEMATAQARQRLEDGVSNEERQADLRLLTKFLTVSIAARRPNASTITIEYDEEDVARFCLLVATEGATRAKIDVIEMSREEIDARLEKCLVEVTAWTRVSALLKGLSFDEVAERMNLPEIVAETAALKMSRKKGAHSWMTFK